nr:hypothetical protein [Actibacterium sp. MT2.3-13A]
MARHGRWLLIAGLGLGIVWPALARVMAPAIVPLIALMLFLAALRLGPAAALPARSGLPRAVAVTLVLQLALPLLACAVLGGAGGLGTVAATGVVLVLAGAPITGTPGLAAMCGADAGVAMRQLILGTALLPLSAVPVFLLLPVFPDVLSVVAGAARLLGVIALATGLAFWLRRAVPALAAPAAGPAIDGAMALVMGLVVIGLMSAVGPAALALDPGLIGYMALAFALNIGLTYGMWRGSRRVMPGAQAAGLAVAAGNRNLAIFLAALPPETVEALLLFVGCYQVPMYLTPLILPRLLRWAPEAR